MRRIFLSLFLILFLFPISSSYSQVTDTLPTLSVALTSDSPYVYKDSDGYTVVVGAVENKNDMTSVANVNIRATFYDDINPNPLEIVQGGTILQVIPPKGTSPYMIKSATPNPQITQVSVVLETFDSSSSKSKLLAVESSEVYLTDTLYFSGTLSSGPAPANNANVYLAFYDNFQPPRLLSVSTIPVGTIAANQQVPIEFDKSIDPRAVGFTVFAESDELYSGMVDVKIPAPYFQSTLVTISDVYVSDITGKPISQIDRNSQVNIQGKTWIEMLTDSDKTPYRFYAQVKQSGDIPFVEFVGFVDGQYTGTDREFPKVQWTPHNPGVYFIETYVWDENNIPLADPGPVILVIVN